MTQTPEVLPETPQSAHDPLSDVLATMHLSGAVLFRAEFREPFCVSAPDSAQLARILPFRTEHIIPFHLIAAGGCWIEMPGGDRVRLAPGDAVLLPYGDGHGISGDASAPAVRVGELLPARPWHDMPIVSHGGEGDTASIVCGFVQCDELLFHPLLHHLPKLMHVRGGANEGDGWLATTIRHTVREAFNGAPGARSMLPRLTELLFVEILRDYLKDLSASEVGWFAAFNDAVAGAALKLLHAAPFDDWSIERLARTIGVSRTVLNEHFRHFLGQPPMQYLVRWRLQLSAQRLKSTDLPVKTIADESGYESEAAFSRAFRRHFALPPAEWRKRQGVVSNPAS